MSHPFDRRQLVKYGLASLGALTLGQWRIPAPFLNGPSEALAKSGPTPGKVSAPSSQSGTLFGYRPFTQPHGAPNRRKQRVRQAER
jgi:hypothetical protein